MKKLSLSLTVFFLALSVSEARENLSTKELKKVEKAAKEKATFDEAVKALEEQNFVIEAYQVNASKSRLTKVDSSTNFIALKDNKATIQISPTNSNNPGYNGLGGITLEGKASDIKMKTDKKGNTVFSMNVTGFRGSVLVRFTLLKDSNQVSARITSSLSNHNGVLAGHLVSESESCIFKALPL